MPSPYDTPADGDFARYVEELGRQSAARLLQAHAPGAQQAPQRRLARTGRVRAADPASGAAQMPPALPSQSPTIRVRAQLVQLFQWGMAALVVFLMASAAFPPLAVLALPLLLAFGALAWVRLRPLPWAEPVAGARQRLPIADAGDGPRNTT